MTERELLEQFRLTPAGQKLLQTIRYAEGTAGPEGYRTMFGGGKFSDLSKHPDKVVRKGGYASAAAGAYQFLPGTYRSAASSLGLQGFTPREQDLAALYLARKRLMDLGGLAAVTKEGLSPRVSAALAPEWASFPTETGASYYGQPVKPLSALQKVYGSAQVANQDALAGADGDTATTPEPVTLPRKDFNKIFEQVATDFLSRNLLNPAAAQGSPEAEAYLRAADKLEQSDSVEDQALAEEYRNQAIQAQTVKAFEGGLDPMKLITKYIETKQNVSEYNKQQELLEKYANTVLGAAQPQDAVDDTVLPTANKGLAYKGAILTSAKDTTGEPGFDFVIPGGRGAAFRAPFNAQVVKVVGNQNWETNLEKGPGKRGYGNYVDLRVKTPEGKAFDVRLAHFDRVNPQLKPGAVIGPGTLIGTQGRTGSTTGAHVSWDMYDPGKNTTSPEVLRYRDIFADRIRKGQPLL